jgi:hypothetical protein
MSNSELSRYKRIDTLREEFYNPSGYADYLKNPHYHHSDKGCKIEMGVEYGNRKGEVSMPGVVKRCITHNKVCSKTGWEKGWDYNGKTNVNYCKSCGKEIKFRYSFCSECGIKNKKKNRIKATNMYRKRQKLIKTAKNNSIITQ